MNGKVVGGLAALAVVAGGTQVAPALVGSSTPTHDMVIGQGTPSPQDSTAHSTDPLSTGLPAPPLEKDPARPALPGAPQAGTAGIGGGTTQGGNSGQPILYLSSVDLLQPNQSAAASGDAMFRPSGSTGGTSIGGIGGTGLGDTSCGSSMSSARYTNVPQPPGIRFSGTPTAHLRVTSSGGGTLTAQILDQLPDASSCSVVASGSAGLGGGDTTVDVSLSPSGSIAPGHILVLLITAAGPSSVTVHTSATAPSTLNVAAPCTPTLC